MIVGTHIDKIKGFGARSTASFVKSIKDMYSNEHEYPTIKAIKFVSCETQFEGTIKNLRDTLYDIASETKLSLGKSTRGGHVKHLAIGLYILIKAPGVMSKS